MSSGGRAWGGGGGGREFGAGGYQVDPPRLVDRPAGDPRWPNAWAINLLRRMPPHRSPVGRKQRVRLGLASAGTRRRALVLRPAIAIVVLVGCGAVASAALGRWPALMSDAYHRLLAPAPTPPPALVPPPVASPPGRSRRVAKTSPETLRPALPEPAPASVMARSAPKPAREPMLTSRSRRAPAPVATDDTTPVLEAMRALRVEGNPARARGLLARYLDRNPRGTLAEEALAMSIEAAIAHHDADAGALARRYLLRYPAGHFSALARRTLDGGATAP
jgi:hypothetical protein